MLEGKLLFKNSFKGSLLSFQNHMWIYKILGTEFINYNQLYK